METPSTFPARPATPAYQDRQQRLDRDLLPPAFGQGYGGGPTTTSLWRGCLSSVALAKEEESFNFHFNGKHLAVNNTTEGLRWRHQDHLGSLRVKTDSTGAVRCRYWYYPYGELWSSTCPETDARKFTGKERDPESGLDYFGARYYASPHGRFTSPDNFSGGPVDLLTGQFKQTPKPAVYADILNPQALNEYVYVVNNPVNHTDPDGHCTDVISCPLELG